MEPDYFERWNYADRGLGTGSMYWFARRYYARLVRRFAPVPADHGIPTLVELGCGLGDLLALLQDDFACTGIDPLDAAVTASRRAAPRATVVQGDDRLLAEWADRTVDVVLSLHVLEHVEDPAATLQHIGRILRPGGLALIATPNPEYRLRRLKDPTNDAIGKDPTHINVHPPQVWRNWCAQAGMVVDRHFGDGLWDVPYVRFIPARLQFAALGLPALIQVMRSATWTPVSMGVNQVMLMHTEPEQASSARS